MNDLHAFLLLRPRQLLPLAVSLAVIGCAPLNKPLPGSEGIPASAYAPVDRQVKAKNAELPQAEAPTLALQQRLPVFASEQETGGQPQLYSFKARQLPIRDALGMLAKAHGLNIVADPEIEGTISVDFQNVPLAKAFDILLSSLGYSWSQEHGVIRVHAKITRTFEVDYIRARRSSSSSGAAAGTTSGASGVDPFWMEFEGQLKSLLSRKGRITVNRLTGTVMVTDLPARVDEIERFVSLMRDGMYRQVDIEVRIVEVTLRDQSALGLDWTRFRNGSRLDNQSVRFNTMVGSQLGGTPLAPSTMTVTMKNPNTTYNALIEALREQGDVRMVSQPRIRIMNNNTASVKVGTEKSYFVRTSNRVVQSGGAVLDTINDQPRSVSLGVTLNVTPQISADGWTILNIMPSITRLVGVTESIDRTSAAPELDVSEASTMVRVRSGELVILGGLIQEETSDSNRSVPGLAEIGGIGNLFKSTARGSSRKELVIFLAPTIQPGQ